MSILKHSIMIFIAGISYGIQGVLVKLTLTAGFSWSQSIVAQASFGLFLFVVMLLIQKLRSKPHVKVIPMQFLSLLGLGVLTGVSGVFYSFALSMIPASVAIVLLFQFVWVGVIIQSIFTRRAPNKFELIASGVILGGTLFASGVFSHEVESLNPLGVACGLVPAVSFATFLFASGRAGTLLPPIQRGSIVCAGSLIPALVVCPDFFTSGALQNGIGIYGLLLGLFAQLIPITLIGIAAPHLPSALSTIMAASELPSGVIASALVLGEVVDGMQYLGVAIILMGVVIAQWPNFRFS